MCNCSSLCLITVSHRPHPHPQCSVPDREGSPPLGHGCQSTRLEWTWKLAAFSEENMSLNGAVFHMPLPQAHSAYICIYMHTHTPYPEEDQRRNPLTQDEQQAKAFCQHSSFSQVLCAVLLFIRKNDWPWLIFSVAYIDLKQAPG